MDNPKKPVTGWGLRIYEARTVGMMAKRGKPMSRRELGDAVGVTSSQIEWYEKEVNVPSQEGWLAMAEATATNYDWLAFNRGPRDSAFTDSQESQSRQSKPRPRKRKRKGD